MSKEEIRQAILAEKGLDNDAIDNLQITKSALKKVHEYAKGIKKIHGEDLECYFFLISPKKHEDRIIRDVYFPEQEINHGGVGIEDESIIKTGKYLRKKGFKILGWAHSHGSFSTFHSGTDNENHITVLNEISSDNYVEIKNEKNMFNENIVTVTNKHTVIISDKEKNIDLILNISGKFKGKVLSSKLNAPIRVGFAYSLVVNADDKLDPYCEVAIKEFCPLYLRETDVETFRVPIKIVEDDGYKPILDAKRMQDDIKTSVVETSFWTKSRGDRKLRKKKEGVYTEEEVEALMQEQKALLDKKHEGLIMSIIKEMISASLFGKTWRGLKNILKKHEIPDDELQQLEYMEGPIPKAEPIKKDEKNDKEPNLP